MTNTVGVLLVLATIVLSFPACAGVAWLFGADVSFREDNDL